MLRRGYAQHRLHVNAASHEPRNRRSSSGFRGSMSRGDDWLSAAIGFVIATLVQLLVDQERMEHRRQAGRPGAISNGDAGD